MNDAKIETYCDITNLISRYGLLRARNEESLLLYNEICQKILVALGIAI